MIADVRQAALRGCMIGNLLPALRYMQEIAGEGTLPLMRRLALSVFRQSLDRFQPMISEIQYEKVRCIVAREWGKYHNLRGEVDAILQILDGLYAPPTPGPGRVMVPLVAADADYVDETTSTCRVLVLSEVPGGCVREILRPPGSDGTIQRAFLDSVWVAVGLVSEMADGGLLLTNRLHAGSFRAAFEGLEEIPIEGDSIGLGVGVAVVSRLLGLSVNQTDAFTGALTLEGSVGRVRGVDAKVRGCLDTGVSRLFVPAQQQDDFQRACERYDDEKHLEITAVASLREAVNVAFDDDATRRAITDFRLARGAPILRDPGILELHEGPVWVLSCVGSNDPFGERRKDEEIISVENGPILECCAEVQDQLERVVLFYTRGTGSNDLSARASDVAKLIRASVQRDVEIDLRELRYTSDASPESQPIDDPTNYEYLANAFQSEITKINDHTEVNRAQLVINLTSGAPQMETMWHLAAELHWFARAQGVVRVQVRRSHQVKPGESRLRVVNLSLV